MERTAAVFFKFPTTKHSIADISRIASTAHTSIKKNVDSLLRQKLIMRSVIRKGKRSFPLYHANRENSEFRKLKSLYNISTIREVKLIDALETQFMPKCIVLFGSYARGEDIENIDIFIECPSSEIDFSRFEKKLARKVELHFNEHFSSYSNELKNNITNGVVLSGFLEGYS